jgi:hypothetical protein
VAVKARLKLRIAGGPGAASPSPEKIVGHARLYSPRMTHDHRFSLASTGAKRDENG